MTKSFTTTIKQVYWDMKVADAKKDGFFYEYKDDKLHWLIRLHNLHPPCPGVFLVGRITHRVTVTEYDRIPLGQVPGRYRAALHTSHPFRIKCLIPNVLDFAEGNAAVSTREMFTDINEVSA